MVRVWCVLPVTGLIVLMAINHSEDIIGFAHSICFPLLNFIAAFPGSF